MSLFAQVNFENEVQEQDMTRIDASKSFASKSSSQIVSVLIKPTINDSAIEVFEPENANWFLDWAFDSTRFEVSGLNNDLKFSIGGTNYSTTLTGSSYSTLNAYVTHVASRMTAASGVSFSASDSNNIATITGAQSFRFLDCSVSRQLQIDLDDQGTSITGAMVQSAPKIATVTIENIDAVSVSKSILLQVYSEAGDHLFCSDQDLVAHEPDLLKWVPPGRSSFKDVYRRAQKLIVAWLDEKGYVNVFGDKFTKMDIVDVEEVRQWATFMSLRLIFDGISNAVDDVFARKAIAYSILEEGARNRSILRLDTNKDGIADVYEGARISSGSIYRR